MIYLLYAVHVVTCLFLILVVLLQRGKGADLSVFGGGTTQAAFGARGAATLLHKLTVGFFILFIVTTTAISVAQRGAQSSTVMSGLESEQPAAEPEATTETEPETSPAAATEPPAAVEDTTQAPAEAAADDAAAMEDGAEDPVEDETATEQE